MSLPPVEDEAAAPTAAPQPEAVTEAAPLAEPEPAIAATPHFDIVRVEPDGSVVIAGRAAPDATVTVLENGKAIGTADSNWLGEWVLVPETPLTPGGVELTAEARTATGAVAAGEQSVIVLLKPDRTTPPIVIASTPGEASAILQGLVAAEAEPAPPAGEAIEIAALPEPVVEPEPPPPAPVADTEPAQQPVAGPAPDAAPAPEAAAEPEPAPEPQAPPQPAPAPEPKPAPEPQALPQPAPAPEPKPAPEPL
ncbi:MAG: hypothetical protein WD230_06315, partial [Cucumibacter sp.]